MNRICNDKFEGLCIAFSELGLPDEWRSNEQFGSNTWFINICAIYVFRLFIYKESETKTSKKEIGTNDK